MKENEILEVLIEGMDKDGQGIAYYNKKIIFVKGALIGERCTIKITKVLLNTGKYAYTRREDNVHVVPIALLGA